MKKRHKTILTLRNQIEAARTVASVKKDEATFGFSRFLEKQLKELIEKQIRADDAKKLAESDNKSTAIWERIKSRNNSKCYVTSESLLTNELNKFLVEIGEKLSNGTGSRTHSCEELMKNKIIRPASSVF
ncbi:hypothetical protein HHI36_015015 [Cryptolaemus montrouzieri]|uniref:Uncharacterized protein n=1 Tax=Cryptolaemus montrouzieri TaxID=559131 RepID=A0ABD2N5I8_9CUCU